MTVRGCGTAEGCGGRVKSTRREGGGFTTMPIRKRQYDLIIIPILKEDGIKENRKPWPFHRDYKTNYEKLDIGDYEEATEAFDIDSFGDTSSRLDVSGLTGSGPQRLGLDYPLGNYEEDKIVGGFEVDINLYPYHVAYGTNCGGAIIDRKWIITAGHCGIIGGHDVTIDRVPHHISYGDVCGGVLVHRKWALTVAHCG
ncbi:unnamed protein product [Danaus chrysippus]|uniref:(African queen) hypothetical protein n=1 Tax=Danaus chrysippus TaxID=151541 RepID=A0A8J2W4K2_9NEOP|nr:unnamed protein product [Danaus chrysippus]